MSGEGIKLFAPPAAADTEKWNGLNWVDPKKLYAEEEQTGSLALGLVLTKIYGTNISTAMIEAFVDNNRGRPSIYFDNTEGKYMFNFDVDDTLLNKVPFGLLLASEHREVDHLTAIASTGTISRDQYTSTEGADIEQTYADLEGQYLFESPLVADDHALATQGVIPATWQRNVITVNQV